MMAIETGGQAFPRTGEGVGNPKYDEPGMTLRDWFAGQALTACAAENGTDEAYAMLSAREAYALADAMIAARKAQ